MTDRSPADVTELLLAWRDGEPEALDQLMPLVYQELHAIAEGYLRRERANHTLQPTAVIHEAYLRLVDKNHPRFQGRVHFYAAAAQLMRRILVDHARRRRAEKRGGSAVVVPLDEADSPAGGGEQIDLIDLDEALARLAELDARKSRVIELRYFGGLTAEETAELLAVSVETVRLDSRMARAWLQRRLGAGTSP